MTGFGAVACCFLCGFGSESQSRVAAPSGSKLGLNAYLLVFVHTVLNRWMACSWKCPSLFLFGVAGSSQLRSKLSSKVFDFNSLVLEFDLTAWDLDWNYCYCWLEACSGNCYELNSFGGLGWYALDFLVQLIFVGSWQRILPTCPWSVGEVPFDATHCGWGTVLCSVG